MVYLHEIYGLHQQPGYTRARRCTKHGTFDYFDYGRMIEGDIEGATTSIISRLDMIVTTLVGSGQILKQKLEKSP